MKENMMKENVKLMSVQHICFGYDHKRILTDVDFNIYKGDFIGLVGSNGSGKSTLIKLMLGLLQPDKGKIIKSTKENGEPIRLGYVSQKSNSFFSGFPATVNEVVLSGTFSDIGLFKRPNASHKRRVDEALRQVDMLEYKRRSINELSGGQQQRVFIARALASNADLLILDEPTSGVDSKAEFEIYELLSILNKQMGLAICLVSHDISAVTSYATRLLCMGIDGFFEHCLDLGCKEDFYRQLYAYDVVPHIHSHAHMCKFSDEYNKTKEG